jgi:hypothetical protein
MDRSTRVNAGVPAPNLSQDEVLSSLGVIGGKRQRGAVIPPCQHCARVHRSVQEKDRGGRAAEAAAAIAARMIEQEHVEEARFAQLCNTCGLRHHSETQRLICSRQVESARFAQLCNTCGRRHHSEAQRLMCSRQVEEARAAQLCNT